MRSSKSVNIIKLFNASHTAEKNKLECLCLASSPRFESKARVYPYSGADISFRIGKKNLRRANDPAYFATTSNFQNTGHSYLSFVYYFPFLLVILIVQSCNVHVL